MCFFQKNYSSARRGIIGVACLLFAVTWTLESCNKASAPKPYGYFRITTPDTAYLPFRESAQEYKNYPYTFALSKNAIVRQRKEPGEQYWINIWYPAFDATIHCSYKPVKRNLRELTDDALNFVYRNASHASAIPEREYNHPEADVYGVLFDLEGNTASSCQFFITDSTHHFFRASVYCNCQPNADSLAPVYDYLRKDVIRMVESFQWK
ncbi:MAG: gliding motility lipoprotein GldD [Paludibacteraceae bacterium]|nr:gliding motility lipoprotein GldD [Paludibacteraceae bacterium]